MGANCVDVDPVSWHAQSLHRMGYDWSSEPSVHTLADVSPLAAEAARAYLREAGTATSRELAATADRDLLTRLSVVAADGGLTNAGSLLFVATPHDGIDYIRRKSAGGDSIERVRSAKPLLAQLREVEQAGRAANATAHVPIGFAHRQFRAIPERAFREAIVNGVTHLDWMSPLPTVVEHVGDTLTVTSPGGFIGGITPDNAMTHPAVARYRSLADALALLHVAERQGVGIDRMVLDLLTIGRPGPVISELDGPYVRVALLGGAPDRDLVRFVASVEPDTAVNASGLLVVEHLCRSGWVDAAGASELLHTEAPAAADALERLAAARIADEPIIEQVQGCSSEEAPAYRFSNATRSRLAVRDRARASRDASEAMLVAWASARGRITSTIAADLAGISTRQASSRLRMLADDGSLLPGRQNGTGRGFHYLPAT